MEQSKKITLSILFLIESITVFAILSKTEQPPIKIDNNQTRYEAELTPALASSMILMIIALMIFSLCWIRVSSLGRLEAEIELNENNIPLLNLDEVDPGEVDPDEDNIPLLNPDEVRIIL